MHRGTVARIFRLWALYARMDLIWVMSDLKLSLTWYLSDTVVNLAAVTATFLLAERFEGIGGWTKDQVLFMLGYAMLVGALLDTFCGFNILFISRRIGRGQLDHTLIQPQPIWMALLTDGFIPFSGSGLLLPGIGLLVWAGMRLSLPLSPGWLAALLVNLAASAGVVLSITFLWGSLAFWAPRAAEELSTPTIRMFMQLRTFPLDGVAPAILGGLLTILPVGFVAWYPSRYLLGIDRAAYAGTITPLAALALAALAAWAFRQGLRHYGRTGSQRYKSLGHRN